MAQSAVLVQQESFNTLFTAGLWSAFTLRLKIAILIILLMILQRILKVFRVIKLLSRILAPPQLTMRLPESTSFSWIVANTRGLA